MDWSRAKTMLILAFLLLNGLLGYQLWMDELNLDTFAENAAKREEMNRLLDLKEIRLQTAVPEGTPVLSEITVRFEEGTDPRETKALERPFSADVLQDVNEVKNRMKQSVPDIDRYEYDPYALKGEDTYFVMNQLHGQLPMFEMRLELVGSGNFITSYRLALSEVQSASDDGGMDSSHGQEVLSAYVVMGSLAETYLPQGALVSDIQLGYHGPIFESETQVLAPYWRVTLSTGEIYYVHAINGAVEGPSTLENTLEPDKEITEQ